MGERAAQAVRERFDLTASVAGLERMYLKVLNTGREGE
jgi:hypothetical protein